MSVITIDTIRGAMVAFTILSAASGMAETTQCDPAEVGYVASFEVKPGSETAFETALSDLATAVTAAEPGAIYYAPYKGPDGTYFMLERYRNEAARADHGKSPEVSALFPTLGSHLKGAPVVTPISAVCP
jgi:quinol monooxygenase YgiN